MIASMFEAGVQLATERRGAEVPVPTYTTAVTSAAIAAAAENFRFENTWYPSPCLAAVAESSLNFLRDPITA